MTFLLSSGRDEGGNAYCMRFPYTRVVHFCETCWGRDGGYVEIAGGIDLCSPTYRYLRNIVCSYSLLSDHSSGVLLCQLILRSLPKVCEEMLHVGHLCIFHSKVLYCEGKFDILSCVF